MVGFSSVGKTLTSYTNPCIDRCITQLIQLKEKVEDVFWAKRNLYIVVPVVAGACFGWTVGICSVFGTVLGIKFPEDQLKEAVVRGNLEKVKNLLRRWDPIHGNRSRVEWVDLIHKLFGEAKESGHKEIMVELLNKLKEVRGEKQEILWLEADLIDAASSEIETTVEVMLKVFPELAAKMLSRSRNLCKISGRANLASFKLLIDALTLQKKKLSKELLNDALMEANLRHNKEVADFIQEKLNPPVNLA